VGVLLSAAGSWVAADLLGWRIDVPLRAALLAVGCSAFVGVCSGVYPAWRASRLDPIAALRAE
jgi:putative ABC transport system permease protein